MRLLTYDKDNKLCITRDLDENDVESYAILSHTWGLDDEEVTLHEVGSAMGQTKTGHRKIDLCGQQARQDGYRYFWIDTCCIDKANHTELSTAITSMYRWYQRASVCYVYLADVSSQPSECNDPTDHSWESSFRKSRWFTRGWTLQELLAPPKVVFYSSSWTYLGTKDMLKEFLHDITGISIAALDGQPLSRFPVRERMRWRRDRQTKKPEDQAYCLLGIFDVQMWLNYGEGDKAFQRLEKEIDDQHRPRGGAVMSLLHTTEYEHTLSTVQGPLQGTCDWILRHTEYKRWNESSKNAFLWYTAPPNHGKSTMAKYLLECAQSDSTALAAYCSFTSSTSRANHNLQAIQIILHQLCRSNEELRAHVMDEVAHDGESIVREAAALWRVLSQSLTLLAKKKVVIVIDSIDSIGSIDSCDVPELQRLLRYLQGLASRQFGPAVVVKIAIFCRPYHIIQTQRRFYGDLAPSYHIAVEDDHSAENVSVRIDMKKYLSERFKQAVEALYLPKKVRGLLDAKLQRIENPDFLWSRVTMDGIMAQVGGSTHELITVIDKVSPTIEAAYEHMLQRCRDHKEARTIFSIIIAAERPVSLEEMDILLALDRSMRSNEEFELLKEHRLSLRLQDVCGLALAIHGSRISFAYPRLRDFLLCTSSEGRLNLNENDVEHQKGWQSSIDITKSHYLLGQLCVCRLLTKEGQLPDDESSTCNVGAVWCPPDYAEEYWALHMFTALQHSDGETCSEVISSLVDWGLDLMRPDVSGKSLLHYAAGAKHIVCHDLARAIIACHGLVTYADHENLTSLHYAILRGDEDMVDVLLKADFDINTVICRVPKHQDHRTTLTKTTHGDRLELRSAGLSALHAAAYFGHLKMVTVLVVRGADTTIRNEYGQTALHLAVSRRIEGLRCSDGWEENLNMPEGCYSEYFDDDPEWAQYCLESVYKDRLAIVEILGQKTPNIAHMHDWNGRTALHQCQFDELCSAVDYVTSLLSMGFDINCPDGQGLTALHLAARAGDTMSVQAMAKNPRDLMMADAHGRNTLHHAASSGIANLVTFILESAKCHEIELSTDVDGRHAIHYCFYNGSRKFVTVPRYDVLQTLMDHGVMCERMDNFGQDALSFYLHKHHLNIETDILDVLAQTCDVDHRDQKGMYPIHHLAYSSTDLDIAAVTTLRQRGASVTVTDHDGRNVLHHAALAGTVSKELLHFLEKDVQLDLHLRDQSGRTALTYARDLLKKNAPAGERQRLFRSCRWQRNVAAFQAYEVNDGSSSVMHNDSVEIIAE